MNYIDIGSASDDLVNKRLRSTSIYFLGDHSTTIFFLEGSPTIVNYVYYKQWILFDETQSFL